MRTVIAISLGAYSLPYAAVCIRSLAENLEGDSAIHLLTDTPNDREQLEQAFSGLGRVKVHVADELWADDANPMRAYAGLEKLRGGHPCWRKLTDPMLLAREGDEVVVVDPDVYFPRRFSFEAVGDATNDESLRDEGIADQAAGNVEEGFGKARRKVGDALHDVVHDLEA